MSDTIAITQGGLSSFLGVVLKLLIFHEPHSEKTRDELIALVQEYCNEAASLAHPHQMSSDDLGCLQALCEDLQMMIANPDPAAPLIPSSPSLN